MFEITELWANAYHRAALNQINMRMFADALETVRAAYPNDDDGSLIWDKLDTEVGKADDLEIRKELMDLRDQYVLRLQEYHLARLRSSFERDAESGWIDWLRTYAQIMVKWRLYMLPVLLRLDFPVPPAAAPLLDLIRLHTSHLVQERWVDAYELVLALAKETHLTDRQRAHMYLMAGEIQVYRMEPDTQYPVGRSLIEQAEKFSPERAWIKAGWGEYYSQRREWDLARQALEEAIAIDPEWIPSYTTMGDTYRDETKPDANLQQQYEIAGDWYRKALRIHPGNSDAYGRLIVLYGYREDILEYKNEIALLLTRAIAVEPATEYSFYLITSYAYQRAHILADALDWCDKAILLDSSRSTGYEAKGYIYVDFGEYDLARQCFQQTVDRAPDSYAGYWGMAYTYSLEENWQEVAHWCESSLSHHHQWTSVTLALLGEAYFNLGRYDDAENTLLQSLEASPGNTRALDVLERLSDHRYKVGNDAAAAERVLQRMRQIAGDSYEADFENRVGHIKYWYSNYAQAAEFYRKALAAKPEVASYHSNLALALEKLLPTLPAASVAPVLDEAVAGLREALRLVSANSDYERRLQTLEKRKKRQDRYGPWVIQTRALLAVPSLIVVEVGDDLIPADTSGEGDFQKIFTPEMRDRLKNRYGVTVPSVRYRGSVVLARDEYAILLDEIQVVIARAQAHWYYAPVEPDQVVALGVPQSIVIPQQDPLTDSMGVWVSSEYQDLVKARFGRCEEPIYYVIRHLEAVLERNLAEMMTIQDVQNLIETWNKDEQMQALIQKLTLDDDACWIRFARLLRALVRERVPVTDGQAILETVESTGLDHLDVALDAVRLRLKQDLPGNLRGRNMIPLSPEWEDRFQEQQGILSPMDALHFVQTLRDLPITGHTTLVTRSVRLHSYIRDLVQDEFPDLMMLSQEELL